MTACLSERQVTVHRVSEGAALLVAAPFLGWLAVQQKYELPTWARIAAGTISVATIVIDGALLLRWGSQPRC